MRVTNRMIVQSALRDLRQRLSGLATAQEQAATGLRVQRASDDPVAAAEIMRLRSHLRDIEQFHRNATSATTRLSTEDAVEEALQGLLSEARDILIGAAVDDPANPLRQEALSAVRGIRDQVIALANTRLGNEYVFAGTKTDKPPFLPDGTYQGDATARTVEVDTGVSVPFNHTGDRLFTGVLAALDKAVGTLESGTGQQVGACVGDLQTAGDQVSLAQAEVGAWLREIEDVGAMLGRRTNDYLDRRQSLEEVDPSESLLKVISAQSALEQAYEAVGRVLSSDITKHLG